MSLSRLLLTCTRVVMVPFRGAFAYILERRFINALGRSDYMRAYLTASLLVARRITPRFRALQQSAALLLASNPLNITHNVTLLFRHKASAHLKEYILAVLRVHGSEQTNSCAFAIRSLAQRRALGEALALHQELAKEIAAGKLLLQPSYLQPSALIFLERYEQALTFLTKFKPRSSREALQCIQAEALCQLALGTLPQRVFSILQEKEFNSSLLTGRERTSMELEKRHSLFCNKRVAIVGPAIDISCIEQYLSNFDCLILPNALQTSRFSSFRGVRISYYNLPIYTQRFDEILHLCTHGQVIPVINTPSKRNVLLRALPPQMTVMAHTTRFRPFLTTNDRLHAIQRIAWDVLKFLPSNVTVFGTSFFMSPYSSTYMDSSMSGYIHAGNVGLSHGPLQSLMFTKVLVASGAIDVDTITGSFVKTSREEYLEFLTALNKDGRARS
jgi:hypothetical protein